MAIGEICSREVVFTGRDIVVAVLARGLNPEAIQVGDVMNRELLAVRDNAGVAETIEQHHDAYVALRDAFDAPPGSLKTMRAGCAQTLRLTRDVGSKLNDKTGIGRERTGAEGTCKVAPRPPDRRSRS